LQTALSRARSAASPEARARHYLDALVEVELSGDADTLADIFAEFEAEGEALAAALDPGGRFRLLRIGTEQALMQRDAGKADALIRQLQPANPAQRTTGDRLRARLLALRGEHGEAAIAWSQLAERLDGGGRDMSDVADAIWRSLAPLSVPALGDLADSAPGSALAAWVRLAQDFNPALTGASQQRIYREWRAAHPRHVASRFPPASIRSLAGPPRSIALLAPVTGALQSAGETVRNGFLAAFLHAPPPGQTVRLYDTGARPATAAYAQAVAEGADVIVGPLDKDAVRAVAALRSREAAPQPPLVALNKVDAGEIDAAAEVLQLGLGVEDDASAIAQALADDGVERIVVFDHPSSWLARARTRFVAESTRIEVVASGTVSAIDGATSVAAAVLGVDASAARHAELARLFGAAPEFTPRRRDDVDAVVALVGSSQLQSLKPALDFHFAGDLPVYVPSTALGGALGPLNGVRVCMTPWQLYASPFRSAAQSAFPASRGPSAGLFAIGVDGFRVANQLARLARHRESIAGSTGMLTLGPDGRIERRLGWGVVRGGRLLARPAPRAQTNEGG
jgi:hypothetical protein